MTILARKGFTLVELMIVISIIGLLSATLYPTFTGYLIKSRNSQRITDVRSINMALKQYYIDHGSNPDNSAGPADSAQCIGIGSGNMCWMDYFFQPAVAASKGRTQGIPGSTNFDNTLHEYMRSIPIDPLSTRRLGDRYIFSNAPGDIHCDGSQTIWGGVWIIWQPENIVNRSIGDVSCLGQGEWGCCSGIGCGNNDFCLTRVDI